MNPISAPLRPGDDGAAVGNLQTGLTLLLAAEVIPADPETRAELLRLIAEEKREQSYRDGTAKAVGFFQESRRLEWTEEVDERTAAALNEALRAFGALGDRPPAPRTVAGQVLREDRTPFSGRVVLSAGNGDGPLRIGTDDTDPEGRFAFAYTLPDGLDSAPLRVAAFDGDGQRRAELTLDKPRPVEIVTLLVQGEGAAYRVAGRLSSGGRAGLGGQSIVVVDRNAGGDDTLASTVTDATGAYRVAFDYTGAKPRPDLQVRAFSGDIRLGASEVRYEAAHAEILDVPVADEALADEHAALTGDLGAHFRGDLRDLREAADRGDVTYLANKTGWDARAVAMASLADEFSARTGGAIAAPLFYTLFRAGLPANDSAVYRTDPGSVAAIWEQGVRQGIVAPEVAEQVPAAIDEFRTLAARQTLTGPALAGRSSLADLLAVSLPQAGPGRQQEFARLRLVHQGDAPGFWDAVTTSFGTPAAARLRLDGQLGYLTLNNAPLITRLHAAAPLSDPVELIEQGFHQAQKWLPLLDTAPPEIPGDDEPGRLLNYADVLAAQLRLSYPTATVAAMVRSGQTPVTARNGVHDFLKRHHQAFDLGRQPVEQFAARHDLTLDEGVRDDIVRIQRVRQIAPGDEAMNALLGAGLDSAYAVASYGRSEFVAAFAQRVGGAADAELIHARARQVHAAVLNIAASYMVAGTAAGVGAHGPSPVIAPAPGVPPNVADVIAYPTLQAMLGDQDYCDCSDCRSMLSPAAYLVDLLEFLDRDDVRWTGFLDRWPAGHEGAPYPFATAAQWAAAGSPAQRPPTPQAVLLSRRPDLQHLPLSCENTNTAVPYIDLVNETLEYFVANGLTLDGFHGHSNGDGAGPAELLAGPQFVRDSAYEALAGGADPLPPVPPLPFHLPLERVRRLFAAFGTTLAEVMETLYADGGGYLPEDVRHEQIGVSAAEHTLLTGGDVALDRLYGFPAGTSDAAVAAALSTAGEFSRRTAISYDELLAILRTRFVNPAAGLIPRLEHLGVPLETLRRLKDGTISDADFDAALPPHLDPAPYGGDIKAWVRDPAVHDRIMGLLVLADPGGTRHFDTCEFRYADPAKLGAAVRPFEFVRLARFIRLWRKLGHDIARTDQLISALYPAGLLPDTGDDTADRQRLDAGLRALLPHAGMLARAAERLRLDPQRDLPALLACFAPIGTALYRELFLGPALLSQEPVFAENRYGDVLDGSAGLVDHGEALRAAFGLDRDELDAIVDALGYDEDTPLDLAGVSAVFRRGWLARRLKLSVVELIRLCGHTGINPYRPDGMLTLLDLIDRLRATGLKPAQALYLVWDHDIAGTSRPATAQVDGFLRSLRAGLTAVDADFAVADDPDGLLARARMALVYDTAATDLFFALLENTMVSEVRYRHPTPDLDAAVLTVAPGRVGYDDFRRRLWFTGVLSAATRDALRTAGTTAGFGTAVDALYAQNQRIVEPFFARYGELRPLHDAYVSSADPPERKRTALLEAFLPALRDRRRRQQARQAVSDAARATADLLDAAGLDALVAAQRPGLALACYFRATATGEPDRVSEAEPVAAARHDDPFSGIWTGHLEAAAGELFHLRVDAGAGAAVRLELDGAPVELVADGTRWATAEPLALAAGSLHPITLTVENTRAADLSWRTAGRGWEVVAGRYLYSSVLRDRVAGAYLRFVKAASLAAALGLTPAEIAHLAEPWRAGDLTTLLDFALLKRTHADRLLTALGDPARAADLARWDPASLTALLDRFGASAADLGDVATFRRMQSVFDLLGRLGIGARALIAAATADPGPATARDLQGALRARYATGDWLAVIKPVNDGLRSRQRDALVTYILHRMRSRPESAHLDTPEKLFEYFLMDVQMEPGMQTSRIRHALSAIQLFTDRCLMNLEPRVAASALNAGHWEWMRRYRVWEANRKVFLWPENWLEPELRSDQSPFFKEMMNELLQGDITDDRAAGAFGRYLAKLDTVAKLEPSGMHHAEYEPGVADDVTYVVARTAGAKRTYHWRRREGGFWTPWEPVKLDIDDDPVIPVLWKSRLFLFWVRVMPQPDTTPPPPFGHRPDQDLIKLKTRDIAPAAQRIEVRAMLCWSEYYNGTWQPPNTSDPMRPTSLGWFGPNEFDRSALRLSAATEGDALRIDIDGQGGSAFLFYNTHSLPVRAEDITTGGSAPAGPRRYLYTSGGKLTASYAQRPNIDPGFPDPTVLRRPVLNNPIAASVTAPGHELSEPWDAPFLYADSRHVFYVTTEREQVTVGEWQAYAGEVLEPQIEVLIPPLVLPPKYVPPDRVGPVVVWRDPGLSDPDRIREFVTEDAYITKGLGTLGAVAFGGVRIGAAGAIIEGTGHAIS